LKIVLKVVLMIYQEGLLEFRRFEDSSEGCSYGLSRTNLEIYENYQEHSRLTYYDFGSIKGI